MLRVLRALTRHGGQLSTARLVRDTKLTRPGVLKVLRQLEALGVVEVAGSDRSRLFRASSQHPLVAALETLFRSEANYRLEVLNAVRQAAGNLGLSSLILFGSAARLRIDLIAIWTCSS